MSSPRNEGRPVLSSPRGFSPKDKAGPGAPRLLQSRKFPGGSCSRASWPSPHHTRVVIRHTRPPGETPAGPSCVTMSHWAQGRLHTHPDRVDAALHSRGAGRWGGRRAVLTASAQNLGLLGPCSLPDDRGAHGRSLDLVAATTASRGRCGPPPPGGRLLPGRLRWALHVRCGLRAGGSACQLATVGRGEGAGQQRGLPRDTGARGCRAGVGSGGDITSPSPGGPLHILPKLCSRVGGPLHYNKPLPQALSETWAPLTSWAGSLCGQVGVPPQLISRPLGSSSEQVMAAQTFLQVPDGRGAQRSPLGTPWHLGREQAPHTSCPVGPEQTPTETPSSSISHNQQRCDSGLRFPRDPVAPYNTTAPPRPGSGDPASDTGRGLGSSRGPGTPSHPRGQEVSQLPGRLWREGSRWQMAGKEEVAEAERGQNGRLLPRPGAVIKPPSLLGSEMRDGSEMSRDGHTLLLGLGLCHQ